jgi:hypothetical protein
LVGGDAAGFEGGEFLLQLHGQPASAVVERRLQRRRLPELGRGSRLALVRRHGEQEDPEVRDRGRQACQRLGGRRGLGVRQGAVLARRERLAEAGEGFEQEARGLLRQEIVVAFDCDLGTRAHE